MKGRVPWAVATVLLLAAAGWLVPLQQWLLAALTWATAHRQPSALVFISLYVLATVCLIPGLILTLAGGAMFGLAGGVAVGPPARGLGARAAVFIRAAVAREWRQQRIAPWPRCPGLGGALRAA